MARKLVDGFPPTPEAVEAVDVLLSAWASEQAFFAAPADYEQASDYAAQVRHLRQLAGACYDCPVDEQAQWGIARQTVLHQYRAETKVIQEARRCLLERPYRPSAEAIGPESHFLRRGTPGLVRRRFDPGRPSGRDTCSPRCVMGARQHAGERARGHLRRMRHAPFSFLRPHPCRDLREHSKKVDVQALDSVFKRRYRVCRSVGQFVGGRSDRVD